MRKSPAGTLSDVLLAVTSRCVPGCQRTARRDRRSTPATAAWCARPARAKRAAAAGSSGTRRARRGWSARSPAGWATPWRCGGEARVGSARAKPPSRCAGATGCPTGISASWRGWAAGRRSCSSHLFCSFSGEPAGKVTLRSSNKTNSKTFCKVQKI